jgi:hypothetical protein
MARDPESKPRRMFGNKRLDPNQSFAGKNSERHTFWEYRQCNARLGNGKQCRWRAVPGGTLCLVHAEGTGMGRIAAQNRMIALVQPALTVLEELMQSGDEQIALKAAMTILDRVPGFSTRANLTVSPGDTANEDLSQLTTEQLRARALEIARRNAVDPPGVDQPRLPAPRTEDEPIEGEVVRNKDSVH